MQIHQHLWIVFGLLLCNTALGIDTELYQKYKNYQSYQQTQQVEVLKQARAAAMAGDFDQAERQLETARHMAYTPDDIQALEDLIQSERTRRETLARQERERRETLARQEREQQEQRAREARERQQQLAEARREKKRQARAKAAKRERLARLARQNTPTSWADTIQSLNNAYAQALFMTSKASDRVQRASVYREYAQVFKHIYTAKRDIVLSFELEVKNGCSNGPAWLEKITGFTCSYSVYAGQVYENDLVFIHPKHHNLIRTLHSAYDLRKVADILSLQQEEAILKVWGKNLTDQEVYGDMQAYLTEHNLRYADVLSKTFTHSRPEAYTPTQYVKRVSHAYGGILGYIEDNPVESLLIGAGAVALGAIAGKATRSALDHIGESYDSVDAEGSYRCEQNCKAVYQNCLATCEGLPGHDSSGLGDVFTAGWTPFDRCRDKCFDAKTACNNACY